MNPIVFHIVSGDAYFSGAAILVAAVILHQCSSRVRTTSNIGRLPFVVSLLCGMIGTILSATPVPLWLTMLLAFATLFWIYSLCSPKSGRAASFGMVFCWCVSIILEIPWHILPRTTAASINALTVIGDSVSAGMDEGEAETWPSLLSRQHGMAVQDLSHVGETAGSAFKRAKKVGIQHNYVIVEIGGNDILGSTSPSQFEIDLEALLRELRRENRRVVMFELPLPPFYHQYGMTQRQLARKYDVALVPKRYFLSILADGDATLDSIHLSQSGHQAMSDLVWRLSRPK
jgi:acyl-CoA thioesterase-1